MVAIEIKRKESSVLIGFADTTGKQVRLTMDRDSAYDLERAADLRYYERHWNRYTTRAWTTKGKLSRLATPWELLGNALGAQDAPYTRASLAVVPVYHCSECGAARKDVNTLTLTRTALACKRCYDPARHGTPTNRNRAVPEIIAAEDEYDAALLREGRTDDAEIGLRPILGTYPNGYPNEGFNQRLPRTQIRHDGAIRARAEAANAAAVAQQAALKKGKRRK